MAEDSNCLIAHIGKFLSMSFGLRISLAFFQRLKNVVLRLCFLFTSAYNDDVLILSECWSDHIMHVRKVLDIVRKFLSTWAKWKSSCFRNQDDSFADVCSA